MSAAAAPWSTNNPPHYYQKQQRGTPSQQGGSSRPPTKRPRSLTPPHSSRGQWQHHSLVPSPDHQHRPRSPTLAFKRLRVSGGDDSDNAAFFPSAVRGLEQELRAPSCWQIEEDAANENYNGSRKRSSDVLSHDPRLRPEALGEERGMCSNPPDDYNYQPVNHLLGELHRQRKLRGHPSSGTDATESAAAAVQAAERPNSCDMSFEFQSTPPPPPPPPATTIRGDRRQVVQLRTDTKLI